MESQPQNPEFRINPENFHPCLSAMVFTLIVRANILKFLPSPLTVIRGKML